MRCGVAVDPGLLTLAASGRRGLDRGTVDTHSQVLSSGAAALLAPTAADRASSALTGIGAALGGVDGDPARSIPVKIVIS